MKQICLYHGSDLDGQCSGAIYAKAKRQAGEEFTLYPIDYGDPVPWDAVQDADVTLIDFSIQPWDDFVRLCAAAKSVLWIDHHKSAIEEWRKQPRDLSAPGATVLNESKAGCELAWEYFFPHDQMPRGVRLLGRYDVWDHGDARVLPYQFGLRLYDLDPSRGADRSMWPAILDIKYDLIKGPIKTGGDILRYQRQNDAVIAGKYVFPLDFAGCRWQSCNRLGKGSTFFNSVWDRDNYHGMLAFGWTGSCWQVGLYSDRDDVDCSVIAKAHDGGGHKGAAGFQCDNLPFQFKV